MATPRTYLWADSLNNRLVSGWRGLVSAMRPQFRRGDEIPLTIRWVEVPMVAGGEMSEVVLPVGSSYALYVGKRAERPFGGSFFVTYNGVDSELIPFNATASELEARLNRVSSISNTSGVTVSQVNADIFKITFIQKGARTALTVNGVSLMPSGEGKVDIVQAGDASNYHVLTLSLRQLPCGVCTVFTPEPACVANVESLKDDIADVYLVNDAKGGYFTMAIDAGEPISVSVFEDPSTLQAKLGAGFTVLRAGDWRWRIQKSDGSAFVPTIVSSAEIISFNGVEGVLSTDTQEAYEYLSGQRFSDAVIEIIRDFEDGSQMVVQTHCTLLNKIYV